MPTNFKKQIYANNATSTLAYTVDAEATSLSLADASSFPQPADNEYFTLTLGSGPSIEIVEVYSRSGNVLFNCLRGTQGTTARAFSAGTLAENRLTAGTLSGFARDQDKLAPVSSLTDLTKPEDLNGNSCLLDDTDDAGNPIVAVEGGGKWRFVTHPVQLVDQEIYDVGSQITPTSLASSGADISAQLVTKGMIIQAVSGLNRGQSRYITSATSQYMSWATPFPYAFAYGDRLQVYQSASSALAWLKAQIAGLTGGQSSQQSLIQEEIYKTAYKSPVVVATTGDITLSGLQTIDGLSVVSGDRVLVKNQTNASQNGIYVVSVSAWSRAVDANDNVKVRANMIVPVIGGTIGADSVWILDVTGPITLGSTLLPFKNLNSLYATLASPVLTGTPTSTTAEVGTNNTQIATTAFVVGQAASSSPLMNGGSAAGTSTRLSRADHVHPSDTSRAPVVSPALTGTPTSTTPVQFDNSTKIATTAFVQRALGSASDIAVYTGTTSLTAADIGKLVIYQGTGVSQTLFLPEIATLPNGASITIRSTGTNCVTVSSTFQNGDWIAVDNEYSYDTYSQKIYLMPGESLILTLHKTGQTGGYPLYLTARWYATAGTIVGAPATGSVIYSASQSLPKGYLDAAGGTASRLTYARLFSIIGTTYGVGDGSTTFGLPDLRGEFIRGFDGGRSIDVGRVFGSTQAGSIQSHSHPYRDRYYIETSVSITSSATNKEALSPFNYNGNVGSNATDSDNNFWLYLDTTTSSTGGTETRPRNIALAAYIKY